MYYDENSKPKTVFMSSTKSTIWSIMDEPKVSFDMDSPRPESDPWVKLNNRIAGMVALRFIFVSTTLTFVSLFFYKPEWRFQYQLEAAAASLVFGIVSHVIVRKMKKKQKEM